MGGSGRPPQAETEEELARRVRALREALERSAVNAGSMDAAWDSIGNRFAAIDAAIHPAQARVQTSIKVHENIERTIGVAEGILDQHAIVRRAEATVTKGLRENLEGFLEAVDQLKGVVRFFSSIANPKSCEEVLNHVKKLLTDAAMTIEDEFRQLMCTCSEPVEPDCLFECLQKLIYTSNGTNEAVEEEPSQSSALFRNPTLIPQRILPLLHDIARQLVQDDNQQSCHRIYRDARVSALEVSLGKLGVENLKKDDVQRMHWDTLKIKTRNWNQYMQIAVKVLLAGERKNCDLVFDGITFNKDRCFAELAGPSFKTLLSFGDAVAKSAKSKMSPEKLSVLLDMYGVMHEVQPQINVIFQGRFCSEMREAALNLTKRLVQMAQEILVDFVDAVEKDTENTIQDENVHPLTLHVIGCAESLLDYKSTLEILQPFETDSANESQLAVVTKKILQALENNLNGRFKLYKDSALGHIFLVNNIHYMVMSIRRSQASDILEDWVKRHRKIVEKISWQYRRLVWDKIINKRLSDPSKRSDDSCSRKSSSSLTESDMRAMVKESFKSFNTEFGALLAKQSQWNIPDMELRQYLRLAVAEVLVQAYKSFVDQFGKYARREKKKNPDKYIKYTPEEVEKKLLDELFAGKPTGAPNQFDEDRQ